MNHAGHEDREENAKLKNFAILVSFVVKERLLDHADATHPFDAVHQII